VKAIIHWNKQKKCWTIHTYKGCEWATHILIRGEWNTEVKPTKKTNPRGWVVVDRSQVEILDSKEIPDNIGQQLIYDKYNMRFNIHNGINLLFLPNGAFLLSS
jgi:hypothetical protein